MFGERIGTRRLRRPERRRRRWSRLGLAASGVVVFCSIVAVPSSAWAVPVPWRNCGTPQDAVSVSEIVTSVWPPQAGESLTIAARWNLARTLPANSYEEVATTWPNRRPFEQRVNFENPPWAMLGPLFFGTARQQLQMHLPLPAGPYNQSTTVRVPRWLVGPIGVDVEGFDPTGTQVVCMEIVIPVK